MASKFKYQERSAATVNERANKSSGDYDDFIKGQMFKPKEGENNIRILPVTWDPHDGPGAKGFEWRDNWAIEVFIHRDVGPDKQTYLCLAKMKGEDCPLCDARGEIDDEELSKKLKAKPQLCAYIIDRADEKAGPLIWRVPASVEKEIQLRSKVKGTGEILPVDHPDRGYDITFRRKGTGLNTDYAGVDIDRDDSPLSEKDARYDDWLDFVQEHPLPDQLIYFDADYLDKQFRAKGSRREEKPKDEEDRGRDRDRGEREPSRDRGRGEEREERSTPRRGREEPEEEDRRGRNRDRDEPREERSESRRSSRDEDREERGRDRGRSRDPEPEPEDEKTKGRYRSEKAKEPEEDNEIPSEGKGRAPDKKDDRRSAKASDPEEEPEEKPGKKATERGRAALDRLRDRGK